MDKLIKRFVKLFNKSILIAPKRLFSDLNVLAAGNCTHLELKNLIQNVYLTNRSKYSKKICLTYGHIDIFLHTMSLYKFDLEAVKDMNFIVNNWPKY